MGPGKVVLLWSTLTVVMGSAGTALGAGIAGDGQTASPLGGQLATALLTVLVFLVLLIVLGKYAWKPLLDAVNKREQAIRSDLETARRERDAAEKLLEVYHDQLASIHEQAEQMMKSAAVESKKVGDEIIELAQTEARQTLHEATQQIDSAKNEALRDICRRSGDIVTDLAARILKREVNSEDHRLLIQQALSSLESKTAN